MTHHEEAKEEWQREQLEGEGHDAIAHEPHESAPQDTEWHKEQLEGEGEGGDHAEHDHPTTDAMGEGDSEFSGHGHNPGGGKQFGENVEAE